MRFCFKHWFWCQWYTSEKTSFIFTLSEMCYANRRQRYTDDLLFTFCHCCAQLSQRYTKKWICTSKRWLPLHTAIWLFWISKRGFSLDRFLISLDNGIVLEIGSITRYEQRSLIYILQVICKRVQLTLLSAKVKCAQQYKIGIDFLEFQLYTHTETTNDIVNWKATRTKN